MPAERIAMRQVRDVLRLKAAGVSGNEIARRVGVAPSTVRLTLKRLAAAGLSWPLPADMTDPVLEGQLFTAAGKKQGHRRCAEPDWAAVHRELKRKHVTLQILMGRVHRAQSRWLPLLAVLRAVPRLGVPQFGHDAAEPRRRRQAVRRLRRRHGAGDRRPADRQDPAGADFCRRAGRLQLHLCPGKLDPGARRLDRRAHQAFEAIGGVPNLLVPDNTKFAVIKACLYEPQVNRTYAEMAAHYGTAVLPTRPHRPRDKAKVEAAVLIIERWILARLRNQRFYSLAELNAAMGELLKRLNDERPIRRLGVTRRRLLDELDRPALKPLPIEPYVFAEWRVRRVGIDYHVDVEGHFYSVPYRFARAEVEVRLTGRSVEIFARGERIAVHMRSSGNGKHTTVPDHMPSSHRRYADWTIGRIRRDAALIGPATAALCELILEHRPHPEQGFRSCLGILRLARAFGAARLEAAATRAIDIGALTYGSVRSILDHKLDRHAAHKPADGAPILHPNIRG